MKPEEQFFIHPVEVWITREGNGIVEDRHLKCQSDYEYYKVVGKEVRYVIRGCNGIVFLPSTLYERFLSGDGSFASSVVNRTRKYQRELDMTWFKYYDDAEEVLNNLIKFILWAKTIPKINIKNVMKKKLINQTKHLTVDVVDTRATALIRESVSGLEVKKRNDLSPLAKDLAEEMDLRNQD